MTEKADTARNLTELLASSLNPLFIKEANGCYLAYNKAFTDFLQCDPSLLHGKTDKQLRLTEQIDLSEDDALVLRDKKIISQKKIYCMYGSNSGVAHIIKMPCFLENTRVFLLGILTLHTEQEVISSDDIINSLPGIIYWKDLEGRYIDCNPYMVHFAKLGHSNEIKGKTDHQLWPEFSEQYRKNDEIILNSNSPQEFFEESRVENKKYKLIVVKAPLKNAFAETVGTVGVSVGIENITRLHEEVNMEREKVINAKKIREEILANMTHEMKSPIIELLNNYREISQLMKEKDYLTAEEKLRLQQYACDDLLSNIKGVIDLSKTQSEKPAINNCWFDMHELIAHIQRKYQRIIAHSSLHISINISEYFPNSIYSDREKIANIMIHFLDNAIKFTKKGYIDLHVSAEKQKKDAALITISVSDSGVGVSEEVKKKILSGSFSTDKFDNRHGTGLGLFYVQRVINILGGKFSIDSHYGRGAKFDCSFTVSCIDELDSAIQQKMSQLPAEIKVLVVDDIETLLHNQKEVLSHYFSEVDTALSGKEAIKLFHEKDYDMLVTDIGLQDMLGFELIEKLRLIKKKKNTKFLALSAEMDLLKLNQCAELKVDLALEKPLVKQNILAILKVLAGDKNTSAHSIGSQHKPLLTFDQELFFSSMLPRNFGTKKAIQMLQVEINEEIDNLVKLVDEKNFEKAYTKIHHLIATCGMAGTLRLSQLLKDYRFILQKKSFSSVKEQEKNIREEMVRIHIALKELNNEH